ncbi:hypothetical protein F511_25426 [Dorcoceras hygrometricum]|uniref:Uncharacterized protein n=1 Tax=Dorcoceras hygrometricum TaxID=472368 RepID=A0A2Z7B2N3_9LAMI|nr:hypothetical protein F511_25426 [Dorcoceras hygrometricum]
MHCSSADASFLVNISSCFPLVKNQQLHCDFKFSSRISFVRIQQLRSFPKNQQMHCSSADAFHSDKSAVALFVLIIERSAGSLIIPSADHSNDIVSLYSYLKDLATGFLSCEWFLFVATGTIHFSRCLPAFYEIVTTQILLAEPLGSLAFKMVQVRQLVEEQQVKLEISRWVALCLSKSYVFRV